MDKTIYSLWIKGSLSPLNHLCVRSFLDHGHTPIIYSFDDTIKPDCEVRNAEELFSKDEVFLYENMDEGFKFGGIAERLKAETLYRHGGWNCDLDVYCNRPFDFEEPYVFRPHKNGIVGNIIKAPKNSTLAEYYIKWTKQITKDARQEDFEKSFFGLMIAANFLGLEKYKVAATVFGLDEDKYYMPLLQNGGMVLSPERYAIHFCGAYKHYENYEPGSYYEGLLKKYNII